jgi:iron complex outermembrane receptor protein
VYTTSNVNNINARGIETELEVLPGSMGIPMVKKINAGYAYLNQDKKAEEGYESVYVLNHLKHKVNIGIHHKIIGPVSARWNFLYQDREGYFIRSADDARVNYQPFWLTDIKVIWQKGNWNVYAEATNLFDKEYYDMGEIKRPGRWIKGGVTFTLDY